MNEFKENSNQDFNITLTKENAFEMACAKRHFVTLVC